MTPDPVMPVLLPDVEPPDVSAAAVDDTVASLCSRRAVLICGAGIVGSALLSACTTAGSRTQGGVGLASGSPAPGSVSNNAELASSASAPATAVSSSGAAAQAQAQSATPSRAAAATSAQPTASASHAAQPTATHTELASAHADPTATHAAMPTTAAPTPTPTPTPTITGTVLASVSAVPAGGSLVVPGPRGPVALFRSGNQVVAHTAICTHMGCTVGAAGKTLQCPCHGSEYDAATGQVLQGPAPDPLAVIAVRVEGGQVVEP